MFTTFLSFAMSSFYSPIGLLVVGAVAAIAVPKSVMFIYNEAVILRAKIVAEAAVLKSKAAAEVEVVETQLHLTSIIKIADAVEMRVRDLLLTTPVTVAPAPSVSITPGLASPTPVQMTS